MTVEQLIEELKKYPSDTEVVIVSSEQETIGEIHKVLPSYKDKTLESVSLFVWFWE